MRFRRLSPLVFALLQLGAWASARAALVYTPVRFEPAKARIVVVIHGCLQSAEAMAFGTGWNRIADENNLVVIYPQVPEGSSPGDCWSWYLPENQKTESGQLRKVRDEVRAVAGRLGMRKPTVFVTGISSGAATAAGLLACFPKDFAAGALHSGPSYGLAADLASGERVLKEGPSAAVAAKASCRPREFKGAVMVIQGTADTVVNPKNTDRIIRDFVGTAEASSRQDLEEGGLKFTVTDYGSAKNRGRVVMVQNLGHAWSGFALNLRHEKLLGPKGAIPTVLPFFSAAGPSATHLAWEFFRAIQ